MIVTWGVVMCAKQMFEFFFCVFFSLLSMVDVFVLRFSFEFSVDLLFCCAF